MPHSSVSLLSGFSAMLSVSLVLWVTAGTLHDIMLGWTKRERERERCLDVKRHLVSGHITQSDATWRKSTGPSFT